MLASRMPGRSGGLANLIDIGRLLELHLQLGAAAEVDAQGHGAAHRTDAPSAQPIEIMPATLKIKEKARKYHFFPSQSTLTL